MKRLLLTVTALIISCVVIAGAPSADESADGPVLITFDADAKRIDLVTEKQIPAYTQAVRGSIRFHRKRLDTPETFVTYFHDGTRTAQTTALAVMEKVQPRFAVWRLRFKSGSKNTPRIHDLAVSFEPIDPDSGEKCRRVYVMLDDLETIRWADPNTK